MTRLRDHALGEPGAHAHGARAGREDEALRVFDKWDLDVAVIGRVTDTGRMVLRHSGEVVADLPVAPVADGLAGLRAPLRADARAARRCPTRPRCRRARDRRGAAAPARLARPRLQGLDLASSTTTWSWPTPCSARAATRRWSASKGTDARAWRSPPTARPATARPIPYEGGAQAVAEAWRNLIAVGAEPLAITDCLNFGNPERPEIMGQFVGCIAASPRPAARSTCRSSPATSPSTTRPTATAIQPTPDGRRRRPDRGPRPRWPAIALTGRRLAPGPDRRHRGLARRSLYLRESGPRGRRAAAGRPGRRDAATASWSCA